MTKNLNKQSLTISNLIHQKISTSKKGISMYAISFMVGSKKVSQTRHFTESQMNSYEPRIEVVQSGGRTLQKSSFKVE